MLKGLNILVTGGTGSAGRAFIKRVMPYKPRRLVVFSRDELKQSEMQRELSDVQYIVGDVRDLRALKRALSGIDVVLHAAAMKRIDTCQANGFEAVQTNVVGSQNIIEAAEYCKVDRVLGLSTDKSCSAATLYGATKLCMEQLFVYSNHPAHTKFSCTRYGNVINSRGSVIPLWREQRETGTIDITHPDCTRFYITLEQAIDFILFSLNNMRGGEIFVPKIPSMRVIDLAETIAPEAKHRYIGLRAGEKLNEMLISQHESDRTIDVGDCYIILPRRNAKMLWEHSAFVPAGWDYASNSNTTWLESSDILRMINL